MGIVTGFYLWFEVIENNHRNRRNVTTAVLLHSYMTLLLAVAALFDSLDIKYRRALGHYIDLYWIPAAFHMIGMVFMDQSVLKRRLDADHPAPNVLSSGNQ